MSRSFLAARTRDPRRSEAPALHGTAARSRSITLLRYLPALFLLGLPLPAQATQYAYCIILAYSPSSVTYRSGTIEIESGEEAARAFRDGAFPVGFRQQIESQYGVNGNDIRCRAREYLSEANDDDHYYESDGSTRVEYVMTGWTGGRPVAEQRESPAGTVPKNTVVIAIPGTELRTTPDSTPAQTQTAADEAYRAAERERVKALTVSENVRANQRLAEQHAENDRVQAQYKADVAAWEARRAALEADWQRLVAACKGGDLDQCGAKATQQ